MYCGVRGPLNSAMENVREEIDSRATPQVRGHLCEFSFLWPCIFAISRTGAIIFSRIRNASQNPIRTSEAGRTFYSLLRKEGLHSSHVSQGGDGDVDCMVICTSVVVSLRFIGYRGIEKDMGIKEEPFISLGSLGSKDKMANSIYVSCSEPQRTGHFQFADPEVFPLFP